MNRQSQRFLDLQQQQITHTIRHLQYSYDKIKQLPFTHAEHINIAELLFVLDSKEEPRGMLKRFVLNYVPEKTILPFGCHLEQAILELKGRIKQLPKPFQKATRRIDEQHSLFNISSKATYRLRKKWLGEHFTKLDKIPGHNKVLFFAGEHIINPNIQEQIKAVDAPVIGGLKLNSGYDWYAQGNMQRALEQWRKLYLALKQAQPEIIVCASAATYIALNKIKQLYKLDWQIKTLGQHIQKDTKHTVRMHHHLLPQWSDAKTQLTMEYNYNHDPQSSTIYHNIIAQAKQKSDTLVVDCVYLAQELNKYVSRENNIRIVDIATL